MRTELPLQCREGETRQSLLVSHIEDPRGRAAGITGQSPTERRAALRALQKSAAAPHSVFWRVLVSVCVCEQTLKAREGTPKGEEEENPSPGYMQGRNNACSPRLGKPQNSQGPE